MKDFNNWFMEEKGGRAQMAKDQAHRQNLRDLGAKGYTGTFDMELASTIEGMDLDEAKKTVEDALDAYVSEHKKMKPKNVENQRQAIKSADSIAKLQHIIANFILAAGGMAVVK